MRGLNASAITRRKPKAPPVVEFSKFFPNETSLTLEESIRINIQLALENKPEIKVKTVELVAETVGEDFHPVSPTVLQVLGDLPLMQPEVLIYSKKTMEVENVTVEDKVLDKDDNASVIIGKNLLSRSDVSELLYILHPHPVLHGVEFLPKLFLILSFRSTKRNARIDLMKFWEFRKILNSFCIIFFC